MALVYRTSPSEAPHGYTPLSNIAPLIQRDLGLFKQFIGVYKVTWSALTVSL